MCILLKLHYAKFDVSSFFCSNVIEEKPLAGRLGKGRVNKLVLSGQMYFVGHIPDFPFYQSKGVD